MAAQFLLIGIQTLGKQVSGLLFFFFYTLLIFPFVCPLLTHMGPPWSTGSDCTRRSEDLWKGYFSDQPNKVQFGEQLTGQNGPVLHFKTRWCLLTQIMEQLLHRNSDSTNTVPPALPALPLTAIITLATINFSYLCNFCHLRCGSPTRPNVISLLVNLQCWEYFPVPIRWWRCAFRINEHTPGCAKVALSFLRKEKFNTRY